jgi:hypothetical protein
MWLTIISLIIEILKLIFKWPGKARESVLARIRWARAIAEKTGDTSELEKLLADIRGDHRNSR